MPGVVASLASRARLTAKFPKLPQSDGETHLYSADFTITNVSRSRIDDWELEIEFPTAVRTPSHISARVQSRSTPERDLYQYIGGAGKQYEPLRPNEARTVSIPWWITKEIYRRRAAVFSQKINARVLVDGHIAEEFESTVDAEQNY